MFNIMTKFTPKNQVQRLAHERLGINSQAAFEKALGKKGIARTTARQWWLNGITEGSRFGFVQELAEFLGVSMDDLGG